jgi:hypothetical protein
VSEPLVIVGNGMAAARLVDEQLTRCALDRHTIAVMFHAGWVHSSRFSATPPPTISGKKRARVFDRQRPSFRYIA